MDSSIQPIHIKDINVDLLDIVVPKKESKNAANGKLFNINYNGSRCRMILPVLTAPFGAGNSQQYPDKYSMKLSFNDPANPKVKQAWDKLTEIDNKIRDLTIKYKELLYKNDKKLKNVSVDVLNNRYNSFIKDQNDPSIYFSLQTKFDDKSVFQTMTPNYPFLIDKDGKDLHVTVENLQSTFPRGSKVKVIIELSYLWVMSSTLMAYPKINVVHGRIMETSPSNLFSLMNDSDEEGEEEVAEDGVEEEEEEVDMEA